MSVADLGAVAGAAHEQAGRARRASLLRLPSVGAETQDGGRVLSRCGFCGASSSGTVEEAGGWFRGHRAECAAAPELVETAAMRERARHSLLRRERAAKVQAGRERKESLRRRACELSEGGHPNVAIAEMWNREAVRSLAPNGLPWSASSIGNLIGSRK